MRVLPAFIAVFAVAALAGCSHRGASGPENTARARQDILALQSAYRKAVRAKDANAVIALLSPDFTLVQRNGKVLSRATAAEQMRKTIASLDSIESWDMQLDDFELTGDTATGRVRDKMAAVVRVPPSNIARVNVSSVSKTEWKRTPAGWRYAKMTEVSKDEDASTSAQGGLHFVPAGEWYKDAQQERSAYFRQKAREEAAAKKPVARAPAGMSPQQARQLLTGLYARYRQGVRNKDAKAVLDLLTDDYTVAQGGAVLPRWEVEKSLREDFARTRSIDRWDMTLQDVAAEGDSLVVVLKETRSAMVADAKGRVRRVNTQDRMRDTWVKTKSGWKTQKTELISD